MPLYQAVAHFHVERDYPDCGGDEKQYGSEQRVGGKLKQVAHW